jgi:hypothetical protein
MFNTSSFNGKLAIASSIVLILYFIYVLYVYPSQDGKQIDLPEAIFLSMFSACGWALSLYLTRWIICPCDA